MYDKNESVEVRESKDDNWVERNFDRVSHKGNLLFYPMNKKQVWSTAWRYHRKIETCTKS